MSIMESKKDKAKQDDMYSGSVDMAQAKIELALLKYKVSVEKGKPIYDDQIKKVRL